MIRKLVDYIKEGEFRFTVFQDRVYIQNYLEVLSLEDARISISYAGGRVIFKGDHLSVLRLLDQEILVAGKIMGIEMEQK